MIALLVVIGETATPSTRSLTSFRELPMITSTLPGAISDVRALIITVAAPAGGLPSVTCALRGSIIDARALIDCLRTPLVDPRQFFVCLHGVIVPA